MTPSQVLEALASGDWNAISDDGDEAFRSSVTPDQMRDVWQTATDQWGPLRNAGDAVVLHDLPLAFERGDAHLQVVYSGERIVGLALRSGAPTGRFGD